MNLIKSHNPLFIWILSTLAIVFGSLTIISGGQVIFGNAIYREAAGNYVPFVVWFNFLAGFIYLVAGAGIWNKYSWATGLSLLIASLTLAVFILFGCHIYSGQAYEMRTVMAMSLRFIVWVSIFLVLKSKLKPINHTLNAK